MDVGGTMPRAWFAASIVDEANDLSACPVHAFVSIAETLPRS